MAFQIFCVVSFFSLFSHANPMAKLKALEASAIEHANNFRQEAMLESTNACVDILVNEHGRIQQQSNQVSAKTALALGGAVDRKGDVSQLREANNNGLAADARLLSNAEVSIIWENAENQCINHCEEAKNKHDQEYKAKNAEFKATGEQDFSLMSAALDHRKNRDVAKEAVNEKCGVFTFGKTATQVSAAQSASYGASSSDVANTVSQVGSESAANRKYASVVDTPAEPLLSGNEQRAQDNALQKFEYGGKERQRVDPKVVQNELNKNRQIIRNFDSQPQHEAEKQKIWKEVVRKHGFSEKTVARDNEFRNRWSEYKRSQCSLDRLCSEAQDNIAFWNDQDRVNEMYQRVTGTGGGGPGGGSSTLVQGDWDNYELRQVDCESMRDSNGNYRAPAGASMGDRVKFADACLTGRDFRNQ